MKAFLRIALLALIVAGCARTSSIQLTDNLVRIVTDTAPVCGRSGAQEVAFKQAAVATIKKGYDRVLIVGDQTVATRVRGNLFYDTPTKLTAYSQEFIIEMFDDADEEAGGAVSAREVLGAKWEEVVGAGGPTTC